MSEQPIPLHTYGAGPGPVIVLHGGPGAPGSAQGLAQVLAPTFHVFEPWQRVRDEAPCTVARHVEDLAAVAPDRAVLVGWSWGAMLALSYASTYPDRVRGIALVGCGTYDTEARAKYHRAMQEALGPDGRKQAADLQQALASAKGTDRDALWGALGALMEGAQHFEEQPIDEDDNPFDQQGARETWDDVLRLQAEGLEPQRFTAIQCPVTMLHGQQDPHPGPATRDRLQTYIPHLEYVPFDRCGHRPWQERHASEAFLDALGVRLRKWCEPVAQP